MWTNSFKMVMSGLAVAGLILLMTFLGHARSENDPARPSVMADETDSVTASASKVMDAARGNPAQREARSKIEAYTLNHPMDVCMAAAGQPDWDALSLTHQASRMDPMIWSTFFSAPYNHYYSQSRLGTRDAAAREEAAMNDQLTEAEDAAVSECLESTEAVSEETAWVASTPAIARRLVDKWSRFLGDLDEKFGDEGAYYDCLKDSDLAWVKWTGDTPEDIASSMQGPGATFVPGPDTPAADCARPVARLPGPGSAARGGRLAVSQRDLRRPHR